MLIVSDTGPLRYLIEVSCVDVLPRLYGQILTTPQVLQEMRHPYFPQVVSAWASLPPSWLKVESPATVQFMDTLDEGEATALSLAMERHADVLLVDERKATRVARQAGLTTAGTLAVLRDAGLSGLVDFHAAIDCLVRQTQFHHDKALIQQVIAEYEAARQLPGQGPESPGQA